MCVVGVCAIFFLTGLSLKLDELRAAVLNLRLNATVQAINLGLVPALVAALTPFWKATGAATTRSLHRPVSYTHMIG